MKKFYKLLILMMCTCNVNCSEQNKILRGEHYQLQHELNKVFGIENKANHAVLQNDNNYNTKNIQNTNSNISDNNNIHNNENIIYNNNEKNNNRYVQTNKDNIQNNKHIIINNYLNKTDNLSAIGNNNKYQSILDCSEDNQNIKTINIQNECYINNNILNTKYDNHKRSKSLPVISNIYGLQHNKEHKVSDDLYKQKKQIEYLKQALSSSYYKNNYPISSPMLYHDCITTETEQSTIVNTNTEEYESLVSQQEMLPTSLINHKYNSLHSSIKSKKSVFDIFVENNNLGDQSKDELLLSQYLFKIWSDDWNEVQERILKQNHNTLSCELVITRMLYKIVHYFYKFTKNIIECKSSFNSISQSSLFNYINNKCINNDKFLTSYLSGHNVLPDPSEMVKNYNIKYGFINKNKELKANSITYIFYKITKLLQDLLYALHNKHYESAMKLKSMINAYQSRNNNNSKSIQKLKDSIQNCDQEILKRLTQYEEYKQTIQNKRIENYKFKNKLNEINHIINQYKYWITNKDKLQLKINKYNTEYDNINKSYTTNNADIKQLENNMMKLVTQIQQIKSNKINCNSIYYTLDCITNNKIESLKYKLLEQVKLIKCYLKKYCNCKYNLDLLLLKNIKSNNDNKILLKQLYNNINSIRKNNQHVYNKTTTSDISTNNNKKLFDQAETNEINIINKKQLFNDIEDNDIQNVIHKISKLCIELDLHRENIKYYAILVKDLMKQIFNNNRSNKNNINQFV